MMIAGRGIVSAWRCIALLVGGSRLAGSERKRGSGREPTGLAHGVAL